MFCQKQMRCHHLDREDQVDSYEQHLSWQLADAQKRLEAIEQAKKEYEGLQARIEQTKSRIEDLKATLHIHWIECDDLPW